MPNDIAMGIQWGSTLVPLAESSFGCTVVLAVLWKWSVAGQGGNLVVWDALQIESARIAGIRISLLIVSGFQATEVSGKPSVYGAGGSCRSSSCTVHRWYNASLQAGQTSCSVREVPTGSPFGAYPWHSQATTLPACSVK